MQFGSERIGVALSDLSNTLASPMEGRMARFGRPTREDHEALATIARECEVDHVIIGLPKPLRGTPITRGDRVRRRS